MSGLTKSELENIVIEEIKKGYVDVEDIKVVEIGFEMPEGKALYAGFKDKDGPGNFCYALVSPDHQCKIFNDGEELVRFFQNLLDRKRSLWQRFSEINFNDMIGAFIALAIVGSFAVLVVRAGWIGTLSENSISKEFIAIVSMVLGFYFGRSPKAQG
jgi:hypothetical protein